MGGLGASRTKGGVREMAVQFHKADDDDDDVPLLSGSSM